ncbi:hypothetical protein BD626DRAFT_521434, partial [Schizophyllum amplum]
MGSGQPGSVGSGPGRPGSMGSGPGRPGSCSSGPGASRPGSVGSAAQLPGPSQAPTLPAPGSSFLSTATDDDDISAFVQDIDRRKPLHARRPPARSPEEPQGEDRERRPVPSERRPLGEERTLTPGDVGRAARPQPAQPQPPDDAPQSPPGRVLATEDEVDARLRAMNDQFMESMRGLGGRGRGAGGSGATSAGGSGATSRLADEGGTTSQGSEEVIGRLELEGQGEGSPGGALGFRRGGA